MANRLARETSPYLQQHANNPVDWYPWGPEALSRARTEGKPILLSIGYSSCHWCHVMERESFEDPETAALMNERFINIKVDREERPDLDSIYMHGVQALTGRGGWPLTAFLLPDGRLFYGGTYFPPRPHRGMPSFRQVLTAVSDAFENRRDEVERGSDQLLDVLQRDIPGRRTGPTAEGEAETTSEEAVAPATRLERDGPEILDHAFRFLLGRFDTVHGGFVPAPKFPQAMILELLLRYHRRSGEQEALDIVLKTLRSMARGGIRDHLGGGFHRYSVDEEWLVPHFEKMLYDNGLLARLYLQAYQVTGDAECLDAATSTLDYLLADLRAPEGGFYSSRDADSKGREGAFYVWTPEEVDEVLGSADGELFRRAYGITREGNLEGRSVLHLTRDPDERVRDAGAGPSDAEARLARARAALSEARAHREPPFRDEKILTAWNAFVLRALAEAGAVLGRRDYIDAARANGSFLLEALDRDGHLFRSWKDGQVGVQAFLEDHAALGLALLALHAATLEPRWLEAGLAMADRIVEEFWDEESAAFFDTPRDREQLVVRPRDIMDNATPSGNSLAVELLLGVARLTEDEGLGDKALQAMVHELDGMRRFPSAFGRLLSALSLFLDSPLEIVLLGDPEDPLVREMIRAVHAPFLPERALVGGVASRLPPLPLLEGRLPRDGRPTAYVCRDRVCGPPLHGAEDLRAELTGVAP